MGFFYETKSEIWASLCCLGAVLPEPGGGRWATGPHPISGRSVNPIPPMGGGADSAHPLLVAPPMFFNFRLQWGSLNQAAQRVCVLAVLASTTEPPDL